MEITLSLKALNSLMDIEADYKGRKRLKGRWKESPLGVKVHQLWYIWELQTGVQTHR